MIKIGISGQILGFIKSLDEILQTMDELDVEYIELWPNNFIKRDIEKECDKWSFEAVDIDRTRKVLDRYHKKACCISVSGGVYHTTDQTASQLVEAVKIASELGANVVNHYFYFPFLGENLKIDDALPCFAAATAEAEKRGIVLVLENEAHCYNRIPSTEVEVIDAINSRAFLANYDPTNFYQASVEASPYAYEVLKDKIGYVHLKNGCVYVPEFGHSLRNKGGEFSGAFSGNFIYYPTADCGAVNVSAFMKRLIIDGYDGFCTIEPHTKPEDVVAYLKHELAFFRI